MDIRYLVPLILLVVAVPIYLGSGEKALTVDEAVQRSGELQGQNITVRGKVVQGRLMCTQMYCGNSSCCNTCSGQVRLKGEKSITLQGENIGCSGKSCNITCTPETGQKYIVKGQLQKKYGQIVLRVSNYRKVN
ncbi:MAG: hypothetical protein ABEK16_05715 [Candidatus Nanohalobium sp.]